MVNKHEKLIKDLDTPMETVRPDGTPNGKNCPRCGYGPCKYEFCLACGQRVYRSVYSNAKNFRQFKNVDEMCEKLDAIAKSDPDFEKSNKQFEILTGRKPETLTQERERVKISMTELLEKEPRENIAKLENKKKTVERYKICYLK